MNLDPETAATIKQLGWKKILPQKNPYMVSFERNGFRANIYLTTGTITIQNQKFVYDKGQVFNNGMDMIDEIFL